MPTGGPASFAVGLLEGFARKRQQAQSSARAQLNEALRLQKEQRENQEAIAKENLAMRKAQAEAAQAESELGLLQQRRAQIMASPGAPFKDAGLEDHLYEARDKLDAATQAVREHQSNLMEMVALRNQTVDAKIPGKTGGFLGLGQHDTTPAEHGAAYAANQERERNTPEGQAFEKETGAERKELDKERVAQRQSGARVGGLEAARATGQAQQGQINEEKRDEKLFPLDKQASELRAKKIEAQSAMAAAAQEIQARQQQQQEAQSQPGYQRAMQGGSATGKGGGTGGLLGAMTGKGGATAAPGGQGQTMASSGQPGGVPTVGQAIGPMIGKLAQMPAPQAAAAVKSFVGGMMNPKGQGQGQPPSGAPMPPQRPQLGQPPAFTRQPGLLSTPQGTPASPPPGSQEMRPYRDAIAGIESRGSGDYGALNRQTGAVGRYQVMPNNVPLWTQRALGYPMTPQQFRGNPAAQDKVFDSVFGGYLKKGSPSDAASMWFTGRPAAQGRNKHDITGTSGSKYVGLFNKNLGQDRVAQANPRAPSPQSVQQRQPPALMIPASYKPEAAGQGPQRKQIAAPQAPPQKRQAPEADAPPSPPLQIDVKPFAPQPTPLQQTAPPPMRVPDAGAILNGYRFKGGNPRDKANWIPAQDEAQ